MVSATHRGEGFVQTLDPVCRPGLGDPCSKVVEAFLVEGEQLSLFHPSHSLSQQLFADASVCIFSLFDNESLWGRQLHSYSFCYISYVLIPFAALRTFFLKKTQYINSFHITLLSVTATAIDDLLVSSQI